MLQGVETFGSKVIPLLRPEAAPAPKQRSVTGA